MFSSKCIGSYTSASQFNLMTKIYKLCCIKGCRIPMSDGLWSLQIVVIDLEIERLRLILTYVAERIISKLVVAKTIRNLSL